MIEALFHFYKLGGAESHSGGTRVTSNQNKGECPSKCLMSRQLLFSGRGLWTWEWNLYQKLKLHTGPSWKSFENLIWQPSLKQFDLFAVRKAIGYELTCHQLSWVITERDDSTKYKLTPMLLSSLFPSCKAGAARREARLLFLFVTTFSCGPCSCWRLKSSTDWLMGHNCVISSLKGGKAFLNLAKWCGREREWK